MLNMLLCKLTLDITKIISLTIWCFVRSLFEVCLVWTARQQVNCFEIQTHSICDSPAEPPDGHICNQHYMVFSAHLVMTWQCEFSGWWNTEHCGNNWFSHHSYSTDESQYIGFYSGSEFQFNETKDIRYCLLSCMYK